MLKTRPIASIAAAAALALSLVTGACALEVPTDTTVQDLNGSRQLIRTYTLPPGADPQQLIQEPFELEGWRYTFADMVKEEERTSDHKLHTETVTLETDTKDLGKILERLEPTLDYDDGTWSGVLTLDHTAIRTQPAGYTSASRTITATSTIGPLDRNDMSYIPATTVLDGVTLSLSNVDWQVTGTDLVGDALAPASYQAVATYSGRTSYRLATGYVTTAEYVGEVGREDVESVTYTVTYLGTEVEDTGSTARQDGTGLPSQILPYALAVLGVGTIAALGVLLLRSRRALRQLQEEEEDETEHEEEAT